MDKFHDTISTIYTIFTFKYSKYIPNLISHVTFTAALLHSLQFMEPKSMSDTITDSDESVVFVGVSKNIKVEADVHQEGENPDNVPYTPKKEYKRRRILPDQLEHSVIPQIQGNKTNNFYIFKIYTKFCYPYIN